MSLEQIDFSVWLAHELKKSDRNIAWLARVTKLNRGNLDKILSGEVNPHESTKSLIRIAFGYSE